MSEPTRADVIRLKLEGRSHRQVMAELGVSRRFVCDAVAEAKAKPEPETHVEPGPPPAVSPVEPEPVLARPDSVTGPAPTFDPAPYASLIATFAADVREHLQTEPHKLARNYMGQVVEDLEKASQKALQNIASRLRRKALDRAAVPASLRRQLNTAVAELARCRSRVHKAESEAGGEPDRSARLRLVGAKAALAHAEKKITVLESRLEAAEGANP